MTTKDVDVLLTQAISGLSDPRAAVSNFIRLKPVAYDKNGMFWRWNENHWEMVDETSLLKNIFDQTGQPSITERFMLLEAFRQEGRGYFEERVRPVPKTWVAFGNGLFDIETGDRHEPTPEFFTVNVMPWDNLNCKVETPEFDQLFTEWCGEEKIPLIYEVLGFCMASEYFIHRAFALVGTGRNGKDSFLRLVIKLLGVDNCIAANFGRLASGRFESARLYNKLVAVFGEMNYRTLESTDTFKSLTGQTPMPMEHKNKAPFTAINYAKLLLATNGLPMTADQSPGFYARWDQLKFPNVFSGEKDPLREIPDEAYSRLATRCFGELRKLWVVRKFTGEGTIDDKRRDYEESSNPTAAFIEETYDKSPDGFVPYNDFMQAHGQYLGDHGHRFISAKELSKRLEILGYQTAMRRVSKNASGSSKVILGLVDADIVTSQKNVTRHQATLKAQNGNDGNNVPIQSLYIEPYRKNVTNVTIVTKMSSDVCSARQSNQKTSPIDSRKNEKTVQTNNNSPISAGETPHRPPEWHQKITFAIKNCKQKNGILRQDLYLLAGGIGEDEIDAFLDQMIKEGLLFEPSPGRVRAV